MNKFQLKFTRIVLISLLFILGSLMKPVPTEAFDDVEIATESAVISTTLDFSLQDFSNNLLSSPLLNDSDVVPGYSESKEVRIKKEGVLDFNYNIKAEKMGGDDVLCDALEVEVKLENVSKYNGSLLDVELTPPIFVNAGEDDWEIIVSLNNSDDGELRNKTCQFDFVFNGWQENSDGSWGFRDEERLGNTIDSGYWAVDKDIVLNEILYNPVGSDDGTMPDGEWVELYNNGDLDIDAAGWKIKDEADHTITVSTGNSDNNGNTADAGETTVPTGGWLVVYVNGGAVFNNGGDTVYLYNLSDDLIDSHTHDGGKPEGNTEARIPDGTGDWIDPLATPGGPNRIVKETMEQEEGREEIENAEKDVKEKIGKEYAEENLEEQINTDGEDIGLTDESKNKEEKEKEEITEKNSSESTANEKEQNNNGEIEIIDDEENIEEETTEEENEEQKETVEKETKDDTDSENESGEGENESEAEDKNEGENESESVGENNEENIDVQQKNSLKENESGEENAE